MASQEGGFAPRALPLSREARLVFEDYHFVDSTKRAVEGKEQQWLAKSETHVLRLACTLTFLAWADASPGAGLESISAALEPNEVAARFMIDATRLVQDYFWPHARAALRQIGLTDRHHHIRRVLRWARANGGLELSLKDVRREALNGCVDAEQARDLVDRLVVAGWLRAEPMVDRRPAARALERKSATFRPCTNCRKRRKPPFCSS